MEQQNPKKAPETTGNLQKDPDDWVTGDEPMTAAQASYLKTLSEEAHASFDGNLTKAEASKRIDALQQQTGRGLRAADSDQADEGADADDEDADDEDEDEDADDEDTDDEDADEAGEGESEERTL